MKYLTLSLLLVLLSASLCRAEMQFPLYESLSPEVQKAYGYVVQKSPGNNPGLSIIIPPAAAKYCNSARLYIRDGSKHILVETNMGLNRMKDGGLGINVNLFEHTGVLSSSSIREKHLVAHLWETLVVSPSRFQMAHKR